MGYIIARAPVSAYAAHSLGVLQMGPEDSRKKSLSGGDVATMRPRVVEEELIIGALWQRQVVISSWEHDRIHLVRPFERYTVPQGDFLCLLRWPLQ